MFSCDVKYPFTSLDPVLSVCHDEDGRKVRKESGGMEFRNSGGGRCCVAGKMHGMILVG
jgi:hypothetical protein